jgi:hypothetical protein
MFTVQSQLHNLQDSLLNSFALDTDSYRLCTFGDADDGLGAAVPSVVSVVAGVGTLAEVAGAISMLRWKSRLWNVSILNRTINVLEFVVLFSSGNNI